MRLTSRRTLFLSQAAASLHAARCVLHAARCMLLTPCAHLCAPIPTPPSSGRVRERLLFAYGFKDTEPWPQFAQSLGIDRGATGAFWMIVGNNMEITGRNWNTAWLKPPSMGFQVMAMQARGGEKPEDVNEKEVDGFVQSFLSQVDQMMPPEDIQGVVEEEVEPTALEGEGGDAGGAAGGAPAGGAGSGADELKEKAANYDKELRKLIAALEMSFNSVRALGSKARSARKAQAGSGCASPIHRPCAHWVTSSSYSLLTDRAAALSLRLLSLALSLRRASPT